MVFRDIRSDEELLKLHENGTGWIYNDFGTAMSRDTTMRKEWNVLHRASCGFLKLMRVTTPKLYFDTKEEAVEWLKKYRENQFRICERCG